MLGAAKQIENESVVSFLDNSIYIKGIVTE